MSAAGGMRVSVELKDSHETSRYDQMTDEALVERVRNGDNDALEYLINKYKPFVRNKARSYFLIGAIGRTSSRRA